VGADISNYSRPLGCCSAGLGFDLASGWGSLNMGGLATAAVRLQPPQERLSLPRHQQPVASHRILATVSCAGTCRMAAIAEVTVGHGRPFAIASKAYRLPAAGGKTVPVPFSAGQLTRLRSGLPSHERIVAE